MYYLHTMEVYSFETMNEIMFTEMEVTGDHYIKQSKTFRKVHMLFLSYLLSRFKGERWEEEIFSGRGDLGSR